jgi:hypothetical protein
MGLQALRDNKRVFGREYIGGQPADAEYAEYREEDEGAGEKGRFSLPTTHDGQRCSGNVYGVRQARSLRPLKGR